MCKILVLTVQLGIYRKSIYIGSPLREVPYPLCSVARDDMACKSVM